MPAGNLLSEAGFPPCAFIIGEKSRDSRLEGAPLAFAGGWRVVCYLAQQASFIPMPGRAASPTPRWFRAARSAGCCLPSLRQAPRESCAPRGVGAPQKLPCLKCQQLRLPRFPAPSVIPALSEERESHFRVYLPRSGAQEPPPTSLTRSQLGARRDCPAPWALGM